MLSLVLMVGLGILAGAGGGLRLLFPLGATAVGALLYVRYPLLYIGFTWWIWFLTPLVRRLIDQQSGWQDPSIVLLAPPLVTLISVVTLFRHLPIVHRQGGGPFLLCFASVFYGFLIGLVQNPLAGTVVALLNWLPPLLFGFHLFVHWREYPAYRNNIQCTFLWGVLVMGGYGVWQYLTAPEWDRFWLVNAVDTNVFGYPEPLGIRVWSTMNSPQPFAAVMMAGLILLLSNRGNLKFVATGAGYLSFLLTLARSGWLSWVAALMLYLPSLRSHLQVRLLVTLMTMALLVIPLASIEPLASEIAPRLESLSNTQEDGSYQARLDGYNELLGEALTQGIGQGLGTVVESEHLGSNDSSILTFLFSLGWMGTIPYLTGMFLIFFKLFQGAEACVDPFASAARAIAFGIFAQIGLNVAMVGIVGMVLWGFLGMGLAASRYHAQLKIIHSQTINDSLITPV
ncbi:O-antigen ligase domain-containing protein [Leptothoe sp. PORK10 BA2]|uniref:O-antigen ligase domain-containing protein n=1 Tax=Leptothoe sp. PORK10 BA2 TaxID=3110254 RepID=UPI002B21D589|nr:O-antigen ligase domain-containing protein [Leptothoe sp. PORK10 BA2]MEA5465662.1 O-antigen ligase domain-containing protein [Leptothoe sp. PORK10 BA2]